MKIKWTNKGSGDTGFVKSINSIPDLMDLVSCGPSKVSVILNACESVGIDVEKLKGALYPSNLNKIYSKKD